LGFAPKEHFFEAMKAILAVQRDHGNREVRASARLKYLVHTLGIDDFRTLTEKYYGQKFEEWRPLPEWKYLDWMGWHEQGDGNYMLGINVEQGRVKDYEDEDEHFKGLKLKTCLRNIVDTYENIDLLLTPNQSIVLRGIKPDQRQDVQTMLVCHGVKMIEDVDRITRKSMACPAFPLCGLAMTEAERAQPDINRRLLAVLDEMGLENTDFITRTTGCPNGCARPYMAELAFVGSGPNQYQVWLGGSPVGAERTGQEVPSLFKMKLEDLEKTVEPMFAMYKQHRESESEAFGDFCYRITVPKIEEYMKEYTLGSYKTMQPA
jgi:sulfite reductase (ferredoxin)